MMYKKRICVGLVGPTEHFYTQNAIRNHVEYLYECLHNEYVDVAISTIPGDNFHEICASLQPVFIDTMSESLPESQARILEYCQGENYDKCILLRFDVLLECHYTTFMIINGGIYFSALRDDGGVEDGFYVIHKEMYTKTIEAFRTIMLSTLTYRHLLTFFDLDDVRLMGMPGTVCIRQCGPLLIV
jgi:hypothetical protein